MGWAENPKEVTTPKLPPPPPRQAQNRSSFCVDSHCRRTPSAVTISTDAVWSHGRREARENTRMPPPNANPAMTTVGHEPPGKRSPCAARPAYTSINLDPAPTVTAVLPEAPLAPPTEIEFRRDTSMTSPGHEE